MKQKVVVYLSGEKDIGKVIPDHYEDFFDMSEMITIIMFLALLSLTVVLS